MPYNSPGQKIKKITPTLRLAYVCKSPSMG
jgi:hypothetical protein